MNTTCRSIGIVLLTMWLVSCGFHLRGTQGGDVVLTNVLLKSAGGELASAVSNSLRISDVALAEDLTGADYVLVVSPERNSRRAVSTTSNISVAEYEVRVAVDISLRKPGGDELLAPTQVASERVYRVDQQSLVGTGEEELRLREEMRRELAGQIVLRADAAARAAVPAEL